MRLAKSFAAALLTLAACGAPPPPAPPVATITVPSASAEPTPVPVPLPPVDPSLPGGSVALASVDLAKLDAIAVAMLAGLPRERAAIEHLIHLADGKLAGAGALATALALDPGQPLVASLSIAPGGSAALDRLRALSAHLPSFDVIAPELHRAVGGAAALSIRFVAPSTDPAVTLHAATDILDFASWTAQPAPDGFELFYAEPGGRAFVALSRAPVAVVVDAVFPARGGDEKARRSGVIEALRQLRARTAESPRDAPVPLDGAVARVRYAPSALADVGFLTGAAAVDDAISHDGLGEAQRAALAKQGLAEAARAYEISCDAHGAFFDRIELWAEGGFGTLAFGARATPGPATQIAEQAWAPGASVSIPGAFASLDVSVPWIQSWTFPGHEPHDPKRLDYAVREVGWLGDWIALPHAFAGSAGWEGVRWFGDHPALVRRLDRILLYSFAEHGSDSALGLLAAGTTPADVACALVEPPAPCAPDKRLRPGALVHIGHGLFELVQVKGRWAVLMGRERGIIEKTKPALRAAPTAPVHIEIPAAVLLDRELRPFVAALFSARYVAEVSLEGGLPTLRAVPAPPP